MPSMFFKSEEKMGFTFLHLIYLFCRMSEGLVDPKIRNSERISSQYLAVFSDLSAL